jgi:simple sugar transport system substrate-binding protein
MKRTFVFAVAIGLLIIGALSACTTATPAATSAPGAVKETVQVPVTVQVKETVLATVAAAPKWCSNVNIVFFPGGPQGGVFAVNVYNGALQAAADLGPKVNYVWSNWDPQTMLQQFSEAVATKPDGIAVMGHPADTAFDPLIDDAESKGIIVTSQNSELPLAEAKYAGAGFGYVGASNYTAGHALGAKSVTYFNLKKGDLAMVWGLLSQPTRGLRTKGVIDALQEAGLKVDELEIDSATNADPTAGTATFTGYVSAHPDVKLIVLDHGGLTATAESYMKAAGKNAGDIAIAGFDLSAATAAAIENGYTGLVIDQQEWLQGYLPILNICLTKVYGFSGLHIDTGAGFVTKDNIAFIKPLAEKNIR